MQRREFLTAVAAAGTASPAAAQAKVEVPAEQRGDADWLLELVGKRYGARLTVEQLATIRGQLAGNLQAAARLAQTPLANGDGPVLAPSDIYRQFPDPPGPQP